MLHDVVSTKRLFGMVIDNLRNATKTMIAQSPSPIQFKRKTIVSDGYGSEQTIEATIPAQTIRIYEIGNTGSDTLMEEGRIPSHIVGIVAEYNASILKGDKFSYQGETFSVLFSRPCDHKGQIYKLSGRAQAVVDAL